MPGVVADQEGQARCSSGRTWRERDRLLDPSAQGVWRGGRARPAPVSGRRPRVPVRALAPASRRRQVRCCPASAEPTGLELSASPCARARAGPAGGAATADGSSTRARPTCASSSSSCTSSTRRRPPSWTSCGAPGGPPSTPWPRPGVWRLGMEPVRNKLVWVRSRMESVIDYLPSSRPRQ